MIGELVATTSVAWGADVAVRMFTTPLKPVPNAAAMGPMLPVAATKATTARARMATARLKRAGAGVALRRASRPRYWRTRYGSGVLIRAGSGGRPDDGGRGRTWEIWPRRDVMHLYRRTELTRNASVMRHKQRDTALYAHSRAA